MNTKTKELFARYQDFEGSDRLVVSILGRIKKIAAYEDVNRGLVEVINDVSREISVFGDAFVKEYPEEAFEFGLQLVNTPKSEGKHKYQTIWMRNIGAAFLYEDKLRSLVQEHLEDPKVAPDLIRSLKSLISADLGGRSLPELTESAECFSKMLMLALVFELTDDGHADNLSKLRKAALAQMKNPTVAAIAHVYKQIENTTFVYEALKDKLPD